MAAKSTATGSYGAMTGAATATTSITSTIAAPIAPSGRRRPKSRAVAHHQWRGSTDAASATASIAGVIATRQPALSPAPAGTPGATAMSAGEWQAAGVPSAIADARVEPSVHEVHREVHDDEDGRHQQH